MGIPIPPPTRIGRRSSPLLRLSFSGFAAALMKFPEEALRARYRAEQRQKHKLTLGSPVLPDPTKEETASQAKSKVKLQRQLHRPISARARNASEVRRII